MADQGQKESFIAALTELGGSSGNRRLREALQWDDANYSGAKEELIAAGLVVLVSGLFGAHRARTE